MNAFAVVLVYCLHNINSGALPYPLFFTSWESRPNYLNKDKFGRLRYLCDLDSKFAKRSLSL